MVDSARAATDTVAPGLTLAHDVHAWAGARPAAWARYLGMGGGAATPLSVAEAQFLLAAGVSILPVWNDTGVYSLGQGYAGGVADARRAIQRCDALGVPDGTYVAADLEYGWPVTQGWIEGWAVTMRQSRLAGAGMIYANLDQPYFRDPFLDALQGTHADDVRRLLLWSANWTARPFTASDPPRWSPSVPSVATAGQVVAWQANGGAYGDVADLDLIELPLPGPGGLWVPATHQDTPAGHIQAAIADLQAALSEVA